MTRTPLKKVSSKQRARKSAWAKVTAKRIADVVQCEVCHECPATEGHHKLPRRFKVDTAANCLATCRFCHLMIHDFPDWAKMRRFILTNPSQLGAA